MECCIVFIMVNHSDLDPRILFSVLDMVMFHFCYKENVLIFLGKDGFLEPDNFCRALYCFG